MNAEQFPILTSTSASESSEKSSTSASSSIVLIKSIADLASNFIYFFLLRGNYFNKTESTRNAWHITNSTIEKQFTYWIYLLSYLHSICSVYSFMRWSYKKIVKLIFMRVGIPIYFKKNWNRKSNENCSETKIRKRSSTCITVIYTQREQMSISYILKFQKCRMPSFAQFSCFLFRIYWVGETAYANIVRKFGARQIQC